jgi:hypothetical protein
VVVVGRVRRATREAEDTQSERARERVFFG